VAQHGQDPALGDEHVRLDDGFVARVAGAGGDHGRAVVLGELEVGAIDDGLVAARLGDAAAEVIGHEDRRRAAEEFDHPHMSTDPRGEVLRRAGLGVHVAARAERADEQLHGPDLAGRDVGDHGPLAGEVHESLLAGAVDLPHRGRQGPRPVVVVPAELAVTIPGGLLRQVLEVQPLQGDARAFELLVNPRHVRHRSRDTDEFAHPPEQPRLQLRVVEVGGERPCQCRALSPAAVLRHRPQAHAARTGDRPVGQALLVLQPQNLSHLSHQ
jgi:hypothetical protein